MGEQHEVYTTSRGGVDDRDNSRHAGVRRAVVKGYRGAAHINYHGHRDSNPEPALPAGVPELLLVARIHATWIPRNNEWWVSNIHMPSGACMDVLPVDAAFADWQRVLADLV